MDIFGLDPVIAAVIFTALGAGLQFGLGWLKSEDPFDIKRAVSTAITTVVTGVVVVASSFSVIAEDATPLEILMVVAMAVAAIAGIDTLKNNVIKAAKRA